MGSQAGLIASRVVGDARGTNRIFVVDHSTTSPARTKERFATADRRGLELMLEAAGDHPLAVLPGLAERMDTLIARGLGDRDLGALAIDAVRAIDP